MPPLQLPPTGPRPGEELPLEEGSFESFDEELADIEETPDGGAYVTTGEVDVAGDEDFFANLAETMDPRERDDIVMGLLEKIEQDKESRKKRDEIYAEGLKRTGFSDEAPGGADFTGASRVVHPMIGKAAVEFSARLMKEIFPATGPVKDKIVGEVTGEKTEKARRKTEHMNWQLTEQIPEFRPTLEQLTTQVPMGGAQYLKFFYDATKRRPAVEAVWIDNLLLPASAPNFLAAYRRTVLVYLTEAQYKQRVDAGMYVDADLAAAAHVPDETKAEKANARIEGKSTSPYNEDGLRLVYEVYVWEEWSDEKKPQGVRLAPYIVTIDDNTMSCMGFYRNWDPEVAARRGMVDELEHIVEFPFIPWRGAYPIGLFHLIGGLTIAATGALRSLLDSAYVNNSMSGVKLKGMLRGGQSINAKQTQINELETNINTDDIRKLFMPYPYNPPSAVLFQLLGFLGEQGDAVVRTALENAAETSANAPVGTTLARIEQGMTVFASIHARNHAAMARVLKILHRINRDTLDREIVQEETGELLALPEDYRGAMDVVPVSDPNIFSEMQRFGQTQAIAQRAAGNPLYDQVKVERRILDTLKIPDPEELLVAPPDPEPSDPVTENVALGFGRPATAFPNQDHVAHLITHLSFLTDPNLGASKLIGPTLVPTMLNHVKEHLLLLYSKLVGDTVSRATGRPIQELIEPAPEAQNALARALAAAAKHFHEEQQNLFTNAQQAVGLAIEFMAKLQAEQQPQDPSLALVEVQKQDLQRRAAADQAKAQLDAAKLRADQQKTQAELQLEAAGEQRAAAKDEAEIRARERDTELSLQEAAVAAGIKRRELELDAARLALEERLKTMQEQMRLLANREDNVTAVKIALLDLAAGAGDKTAVSTGHGNPSPSLG